MTSVPRRALALPFEPWSGLGRPIGTTMARRAVAVVAIAFGTLMSAPPMVSALTLAQGGVKVFDDADCHGNGHSSSVTPPFSIGVTGLSPSSTEASVSITDKDAMPDIIYGPATLEHVDKHGDACLNVLTALAGSWKIEVVEPSNGYNKSKVFRVEGTTTTTTTTTRPPTTTTSTRPPTTTTSTRPPATTTSTRPPATTTTRPPTTTTRPPTTTTRPTTTTQPPTTARPPTSSSLPESTTTNQPSTPVMLPFPLLPWTFEQPEQFGPPVQTVATTTVVTSPSSEALPRTGGAVAVPLGALGVMMLTLGALIASTSRRRTRT